MSMERDVSFGFSQVQAPALLQHRVGPRARGPLLHTVPVLT